MRLVAVATVFILLAAALPATARAVTDECPSTPTAANPCVRLSTPSQTPEQVAGTYYLWGNAAKCAPTFFAECSGRPTNGGIIRFIGVLYEESNNAGGLQRSAVSIGSQSWPADSVLLV